LRRALSCELEREASTPEWVAGGVFEVVASVIGMMRATARSNSAYT
jgi:hypothetical protein